MDESGLEASTTIGPYAEGSTVEVSCEVSGGRFRFIIKCCFYSLQHLLFTIASYVYVNVQVKPLLILNLLSTYNYRINDCFDLNVPSVVTGDTLWLLGFSDVMTATVMVILLPY